MNYAGINPPGPTAQHARIFFLVGVFLEASLSLVAVGLAWVLGLPHPAGAIDPSTKAVLLGVVGTIPLFGLLLVCTRVPRGPVWEVLRAIRVYLVPYLRYWNTGQVLLISALAGFGEEVLFRGVIQPACTPGSGGFFPSLLGILAGAVLFGALHAVNSAYAVFATLVGIYLGALYAATGNLLVPIIAHGLYDFGAILYFQRKYRQESSAAPPVDS
jgi:membrane protease YdiL (CAAX protease family)